MCVDTRFLATKQVAVCFLLAFLIVYTKRSALKMIKQNVCIKADFLFYIN